MKKGSILFLFAVSIVFFGPILKTSASLISGVTAQNVSANNVKISWKKEFASYGDYVTVKSKSGTFNKTFQSSCPGLNTYYSTSTCINVEGLTPGIEYIYQVFSTFTNINAGTVAQGISEGSQAVTSEEYNLVIPTATTTYLTYPIAPTSIFATVSTSSSNGSLMQHNVYLQWTNITQTNYIAIMKSHNGNDSFIPLSSFTITNFTDYEVESGNSYNYKIKVCNGDLCSYSPNKSVNIPQVTVTQAIIEKPYTVNGISTSTNSITLNWGDKSNNETMFKIYRSGPANGTSVLISTRSAGNTTYTDTNLLPGNYTYSIDACNEVVCSGVVYFSPQVNIPTITDSVPVKPFQPTIISLSTSTTAGSVEVITTFSWNPVTGATGYKISSSNNTGASTTSSTSFVVGRNLTPGTYTYYLTACAGDNNCSNHSYKSITIPQVNTAVTATTTVIEKPNSPTNLSIATNTNFTANLTWSTNTELTYNIKNVSSGVVENNKTSPYNVGTLPYGTSYFSVQSCLITSPTICSDFTSTSITIPQPVVLLKPNSPINAVSSILSSYNNSSYVGISWLDKSDDEDSFKITRTYGDQSKTYELSKNSQFYNDSGLTSGLYTYNIYACNTSGCSTPVSTSINIPDAPSKVLSGKVTFPDGKLIAGAKVTAYNVTKSVSVITDTFGKYSLTFPGGIYTISVTEENLVNKTWVVDNTNVFIDVDKVVNFSVKQLASTLNTTVTDEFGNPLSNIGIIISNNEGVRVATQITDAKGNSSTLVNVGNYTINTVFSQNLLYIPAERQTISINNNENKNISFVLKKKAVSNVFELRGATKFDDGLITNAYVSAWSDNGGYRSAFSSYESGEFTLNLSDNDTWHISAKKDMDGKSYETTETVITKNTYTSPISLFFIKSESEVLPQTVSTKTVVTETVKVETTDGAGITLSSNSTNSSGSLDIQVKPTTEAPTQKSAEVVSTVYDITIKNNTGGSITTLSSEAIITLPYNEDELRAQGISVENIIPSYFDEKIGTWVSVPKFTIDKNKKIFTLYVQHLTRFALIASADTTAPSSPTNIVTDAITPTDVKIIWQNPQSDFHHVKIYRSDKFGSYGDLVAAEVFSTSFIDKTYSTSGKTYYYTVRSVDNAGNESNNFNQIASSIIGDKFASKNKSTSLTLPPGQVVVGVITRKLSLGSKGEDVTALQGALKADGFYATGPITGYYGKLTKNAVTRFQNYYKSELLTPNGYKTGTGIVGPATMKKINEILANNS